jgi:hypothetical protein
MVYPNSADKTLLTDPSRSAAQDASLDRGLHSKLSMPNGSIRAASKTLVPQPEFKFHRGHIENPYE